MDGIDKSTSADKVPIKVFQQSVESVKRRVETWRKEQERSQAYADALKERIWDTENQLSEAVLRERMLQEKNEAYEKEIGELKRAFEKTAEENFKMCTESCKLEKELAEERSLKENLHSENDELKVQVENMKTEISSGKSEKLDLLKYLGSLEEISKKQAKELSDLTREKDKEKKLMEGRIQKIEADFKEVKNLNDVLQNKLKEEKLAKEEASSKHQQTLRQLREANESRDKYKSKSEELILKVDKVTEKMKILTNLDKSFKKEKEENTSLRNQLQAKTKEAEKLKQNYETEVCVRKSAEDILMSLKKELVESHREKEILEKEVKETKGRLYESKTKMKEFERLSKRSKKAFEEAESLYVKNIEKIEKSLSEARSGLQQKIKANAELEKSRLAAEYELRESVRMRNEKEATLKAFEEREGTLRQRNAELEYEVRQLRSDLCHQSQEVDSKDRNDYEESVLVNQMVTRLRLSRKKYEGFKEHFTACSSPEKVSQLMERIKKNESDFKTTQHELKCAKEELDNMKTVTRRYNGKQLDIYEEGDDYSYLIG